VVNEDQPLCCDPVIDYSMKRVFVKTGGSSQLVHLIVSVTADKSSVLPCQKWVAWLLHHMCSAMAQTSDKISTSSTMVVLALGVS